MNFLTSGGGGGGVCVALRLTLWLVALVGCLVCIAALAASSNSAGSAGSEGSVRISGETVGSSGPKADILTVDEASGVSGAANNSCTPRSVETFPPDLFTLEQKQHGAIVIHVLVTAWLFLALALVCNDYLVASLEVICESFHMKPDVAGATFMAAGNSSIELLASVIGVFLAQSDVGVSTIVGSAIFNNLMIVSLCGLAAVQAVQLSWWPMFRDCGFYCVSVAALIAVIHDGLVSWYESVIQLALFTVYIVIMVFNDRLEAAVTKRFPQLAPFRNGGSKRLDEEVDEEPEADGNGGRQIWTVETIEARSLGTADVEFTVTDSGPESPFTVPNGLLRRAHWVLTLPWTCAFFATIPDCRRPGIWRRLVLLTFLLSVLWISGIIYILVWMVCATGDALGIPDTVMGLTLLAIGTCLPDAMAGIFVTRSGMGDMAIANSIASNVFDITACLGLPWFIRTALLSPGSHVVINSTGLTYTSIMLLSTIIFLLVAVHLNKMQLDRRLGFIFLAVYLAVVTFACLYETNVFGPLNPPPCPRTRL